jgi:hypothetical protein
MLKPILLSSTSLACTVTNEVLTLSAWIEDGLALIVVLGALNDPVKTTEIGFPMVVPAMVPVMFTNPTVVEAVNVAMYVPLPLSVTLPTDPDVVLSITVPPLEVRLLLFASLACTVSVKVLTPSAAIVAGLALMTVFAALTGPGTKATQVGTPIATPLMVPVIYAEPTVVEEVKIAV